MNLITLGSSSKGNCYILENKDEAIIIEAGIKPKKIREALKGNIEKVKFCLISHEHEDHAKYYKDIKNMGIDVYTSEGTFSKIEEKPNPEYYLKHLQDKYIKDWNIKPLNVYHDAAEPFGFVIKNKKIGSLLFATDTYYMPYRFKNLNNIMIECNYDKIIIEELLYKEKISEFVAKRTYESHFEIQTLIEFLKCNEIGTVNNIILLHLSENNSNSCNFIERIQSETGVNTLVASDNKNIEIGKFSF